MAIPGPPSKDFFTHPQRVLLCALALLLASGLALSSLFERRQAFAPRVIRAEDTQDLQMGREAIEERRVIYVNEDDIARLETLPGIGPELAKRIVVYRETHGPFSDPESLLQVKGIGPAAVNKIKTKLSFMKRK